MLAELKNAVALLNHMWPKLGKAEVITWGEYVKRATHSKFLETQAFQFSPTPDCILVSFDFCTDGLSPFMLRFFIEDLHAFTQALGEMGHPLFNYDGTNGSTYCGLSVFSAS